MPAKIRKGTVLQQLPVMPMIDLVFNLLLFFVMASRFAEEERELKIAALPVASEARPLTAQPHDVLISIDREGQCVVAGKTVATAQLDRLLRTVAATNPGRASVVIRVDERCFWKFVAPVLNACLEARIYDYRVTTLATRPPPRKTE